MSNAPELFLETPPINFTFLHGKVLKKLLTNKQVEQKTLITSLRSNKSSLSKVVDDLASLGWCREEYNGSRKEVSLKIHKQKEIKSFLDRWDSISKKILLRPHSIILNGLITYEEEGMNNFIRNIAQMEGVKYYPSYMKNNVQHNISLPEGNITTYASGNTIKISIENFILPLDKADLPYLIEYIMQGINYRFRSMLEFIEKYAGKCKIKVLSTFCLKNLHLGLITREDINKTLLMRRILKENNLIADNSIYGVKEVESHGPLEIVVSNIANFINECSNCDIPLLDCENVQDPAFLLQIFDKNY